MGYLLRLTIRIWLICLLLATAAVVVGQALPGGGLLVGDRARNYEFDFAYVDVNTGLTLPIASMPDGIAFRRSQDGRQLAQVVTWPNQSRMVLYALDTVSGELTQHEIPFDSFGSPSLWWSPDTRWMAVFAIGQRYLVDMVKGDIRHLPVGLVSGVWFDDSQRFAYVDQEDGHTGLRIVHVESDETQFLPGPDNAPWSEMDLAPDESAVFYIAGGMLHRLDLASGETVDLISARTGFWWSPDGERLAVFTSDTSIAVIDRVTGDIEHYDVAGLIERFGIRWSPGGDWLFFFTLVSDERFLVLLNTQTGTRQQYPISGIVAGVRWIDATTFVFVTTEVDETASQWLQVDLATGEEQRFTSLAVRRLIISDDGEWAVFSAPGGLWTHYFPTGWLNRVPIPAADRSYVWWLP